MIEESHISTTGEEREPDCFVIGVRRSHDDTDITCYAQAFKLHSGGPSERVNNEV